MEKNINNIERVLARKQIDMFFFYYISILLITYNFFPISENIQNDEVVAFIFRSSEYQSTAS
jgi:hypothetical protein